ncbi:MAG TPA: flagellar export chaperone FliS [Phycisphaerae bacterium]|nr:flagellar export chaperone FliS [Phycisphaerae bacterium]
MTSDASGEYLRNAVMTAAPEQLQLMLYDGAIRFVTQAREAMTRADYETSCEKLIRAQNIVLEMRNGLRPEVNPGLCAQMSGLYTFIYNQLVDANMKRSLGSIDDALRILEHQRETWRLLIERMRSERGRQTPAASRRSEPAGRTAGLSLCVDG